METMTMPALLWTAAASAAVIWRSICLRRRGGAVLDCADTSYAPVAFLSEWGWGQSFHFSPSIPGASRQAAARIHEERVADLISAQPGQKILDIGCGVGGPMRTIARKSGSSVVGLTISKYQAGRARALNQRAGLSCEVVTGDFLRMPFDDGSFDGAYSIEATCHAPRLGDVYAEIFRVLKPGGLYVSYDHVTTGLYRPEDDINGAGHVETVRAIERICGIPGLRSYGTIGEVAREVGFEVVEEKDLAKEPSAGPWWAVLAGRGERGVGYWRDHLLLAAVELLGIAPRGVTEVHEMMREMALNLYRGGQAGIVSPMYMILLRKPLN